MTNTEESIDSHVAAALDRAFPDRDAEGVAPAGISWNEGNETVRVDDAERWAFVRRHLDADHDTLVDLGCAEGYFVDAAAAARTTPRKVLQRTG